MGGLSGKAVSLQLTVCLVQNAVDFGHEEELSYSYCGLWKRNSETVTVDFGRGTQRQLLWSLDMKRNSATVTVDFGLEKELSDSYCGLWT